MPALMKLLRLLVLGGAFTLFSLDCLAQASQPEEAERPLTRKEKRAERKKQKNAPLVIPELSRDGFKVSGGSRIEVKSEVSDSLIDSLASKTDSLLNNGERPIIDSLTAQRVLDDETTDNLAEVTADGEVTQSISETDSASLANMSSKERKRIQRALDKADTTLYRHSPLFRDTMSISKVTALSVVVPGFAQLYNGDYFKIPVLYAATGTSLYFGIKQHNKYKTYKKEYDALMLAGSTDRSVIDPIQTRMMQHNAWRQLLFAGAIGSYIYFIGDGMLNYPAHVNQQIRTATILSLLCPGAGQIYNGSYWKVPIVAGSFAAMTYVIDWNNRIYKRYLLEFNKAIANGTDASSSKSMKDSARRQRDLTIIITAAIYLFNVMDAHVDAQLQDYDISDDLAYRISLTPELGNVFTHTTGGCNTLGFNLSISF